MSYPDAPPEVIFPDGQRASTTYNGTTATTSLYGADNSLDERLTTYQVGTPDESWVHTVYNDDGGHTVYYPDSTPDHFGADGTRTEIINDNFVTFTPMALSPTSNPSTRKPPATGSEKSPPPW